MTEDHMPLSDAELMDQLRQSDPVVDSALPSPGDPTTQQLIERIMNDEETMTSPINHQSEPLEHPAVTQAKRQAGKPRRRLGYLIASAAAVVFLVAGALTLAPQSTEPALAAVHSAAAATSEVDSGRVTIVADADGTDGAESQSLTGRVDAAFSGEDFEATIAIDEAPSDAGFEDLPVSESRLVDGVVYIGDGTQWYSIEAPEFLGEQLQDAIDPRSVLERVEELVEASEVGTVTVDGVETTHYQSVVDLQDESLGQAGWLPIDGADVDVEGEVQVDLFVDADGLLRKLELSGDLNEPSDGEGAAVFNLSIGFSDLGADLTIEAPADAQPIAGPGGDIAESLLGE